MLPHDKLGDRRESTLGNWTRKIRNTVKERHVELGGKKLLASGSGVVHDGIEFDATPSPRSSTGGKVFYIEDHGSRSGRCPILSDFGWQVDAAPAAGRNFSIVCR